MNKGIYNPNYEQKPLAPYLEIKLYIDTTNTIIEDQIFKIPSEHIVSFSYSIEEGSSLSATLELIDSYNSGRRKVSFLDEMLVTLYTVSTNPRLKIKFGWQNEPNNKLQELNYSILNYTYNRTNKGLYLSMVSLFPQEIIKKEKSKVVANLKNNFILFFSMLSPFSL